jgi:hypothetical protein
VRHPLMLELFAFWAAKVRSFYITHGSLRYCMPYTPTPTPTRRRRARQLSTTTLQEVTLLKLIHKHHL